MKEMQRVGQSSRGRLREDRNGISREVSVNGTRGRGKRWRGRNCRWTDIAGEANSTPRLS